jgi:hypothetical protein
MDKTPEQIACDLINCHSCEFGHRTCDEVASAVIAHVTPTIEANARAAAIEDAYQVAEFANRWIGEWEEKYGNMSVSEAIRALASAPAGFVCVPVADLEHIMKYWNGSYNEKAMSDALDHILCVVDSMLAARQK